MYTTERGITKETLDAFGFQEDDSNVVSMPYGKATKFRKGWEPGEREFWWAKDGTERPGLFNAYEARRSTVFICEGESDTMRLWQEVTDHDATGVVGIPGINGFKVDDVAYFEGAERIFAIFDNDTDYAVRSQSDQAWLRMREAFGRRVKRVSLPTGTKDICEFFENYNLDAFRLLLGQTVASRFHPLDLTKEPPPTKWLAQGMIAQGDVHLLFGEPTVGKSWLTLDLAVAVAEGRNEWLGYPLRGTPARVLYVDEENPLDVVLQRLSMLGLDAGVENLRFLHHPGVRLDKDPTELLEEVLAYEPKLIVLDSLTRLHTEDENSAGSISKLFNDGIIPLAHETGAAVVLIHHANKSDSNNSYRRSRGSGDIIGAPDTSFDIRMVNETDVNVVIAKSRRVPLGYACTVKRVVTGTDAWLRRVEVPF
jgi:hypothetical protein